MKIKCKVCNEKFHVASQSEVKCNRANCPHSEFGLRDYKLLSFTEYPKDKFDVLEDWQTPEPKPYVSSNVIDVSGVNGWFGGGDG